MNVPWWVAAGWAIDLFLGGERRAHDDLEIGVPRSRFAELVRAFDGYELFVVGDGLAWPPSEAAMSHHHQTWVRERGTGLWRLDIFREPTQGDTWICRRDPRIAMPTADVVERTRDGIPYLRPELVLLFKAKAARDKDDDDLQAVLPHLRCERRRWLADAVALVHPGHRWLDRLAGPQ